MQQQTQTPPSGAKSDMVKLIAIIAAVILFLFIVKVFVG